MRSRKFVFLLLMIVLLVQMIYLIKYVSLAYFKNESVLDDQETEVILNEDEMQAFDLVNEYREKNGLQKLRMSKDLQRVAEIKARDLVESEYFSHTSLTYGSTFNIMKDKGIRYKVSGENLAGNISSEKAVEAWINSETHRNNILDDEYNYTALCVVESPIYGKVFVQLFMGI